MSEALFEIIDIDTQQPVGRPLSRQEAVELALVLVCAPPRSAFSHKCIDPPEWEKEDGMVSVGTCQDPDHPVDTAVWRLEVRPVTASLEKRPRPIYHPSARSTRRVPLEFGPNRDDELEEYCEPIRLPTTKDS